MPHPVRHPIFARLLAAVTPSLERAGLGERRRELLAGLAGDVLEVGIGAGHGFAHYPPGLRTLVAVEPEPWLRSQAQQRADQLRGQVRQRAGEPRPAVHVVGAVAERLPFADGSFDTVVVSLVLCSVADPAAAVAELRRVLRPGGDLRFIEHVRAEPGALRRLQRVADTTLWPWFAGGCHTGRDTLATLAGGGFTITSLEHSASRLAHGHSRPPHTSRASPCATHERGQVARDVGVVDQAPRRPRTKVAGRSLSSTATVASAR